MGRELRQRKPVTYNESLLSAEASSSAVSKDENTDHGSLLKFTRTGINNTANCNALQTASADIKQYKRNRSSARKEAGHRSQSRRSGSSSQAEGDCEADSSNDEEGDAVDADDDAYEFQQPIRRRSAKSAYTVDVSDSEPGSDSDASPANAKGSRRTLRGNTSKSKAAAAPARRQPSRTAAAKVSLAEANSDSSSDSSSSSDEGDKGSNRKRTGLSSDKAAVKRQKAVIEDSDCSMGDAANTHKELGLVSDSEAVSDEESDKENQPASPQAAAVKTFKRAARQGPRKQKQAQAKGASTVGKAHQRGKTSSKKAAAAPARKKKPVVLSSGSEAEEEEEESSSEDEAEGLEIERVLHGRRNADTKQEEFLVKFKGDSVGK
ncbi:TPA: hypothetical protein ACH3X3_012700 [Trebouxia sp. C0006]